MGLSEGCVRLLCDYAVGLTSRRLCKWCCGPRGPMAAPSPEPICSTSIWTLFSSRMPLVLAKFWRCCRNATRPESTNNTKSVLILAADQQNNFSLYKRMSKPLSFQRVRFNPHRRLQTGWLVAGFHRPYWQCDWMYVMRRCCVGVWQYRGLCVCVCVQQQVALIRPIQWWRAVAVNDRTWLTVMVGVI